MLRRPRPSSLPNHGVLKEKTDSKSDSSSSDLQHRYGIRPSEAAPAADTLLNLALSTMLGWGLSIGLIFGGCCSNVFALEAIVKDEPDSGLLITFIQFAVTFLLTLPSHVSLANPPTFLKKPIIPVVHWLPAILMFFTVNMMNNFAFGFAISVPVHIILRSGGSVTTMLVGYIWGKRYNRGEVLGVAMLTIGVIIAAMADAQSKGETRKSSSGGSTASFLQGLLILFVAQLLSALMGLYVQLTYARYGPHWNENLFYSHFLSLPLFMPFLPGLWSQFLRLINSPPLTIDIPIINLMSPSLGAPTSWYGTLGNLFQSGKGAKIFTCRVPVQVVNLLLNSITQYACIRGVNLLGARTSALGVTIVLNLRKLVSLFISIWLFGNKLPVGVLFGAATVFAGAAVYAWAGQKDKQQTDSKSKKG